MESKTLHLLCLGSKTTQPKDIRFAENEVKALRENSGEESPPPTQHTP